jgi:hypothetical protein
MTREHPAGLRLTIETRPDYLRLQKIASAIDANQIIRVHEELHARKKPMQTGVGNR